MGQGYVGLPLAMRAVEVGHDVVGLDVDTRRCEMLASARSYVDDVPSEVLLSALASGRYRPSGDYSACEGFDVAVITVPTPLTDGAPDLSHVVAAGEALAPYVSPGCIVVLESTTYPGSTSELLRPILEAGSGLRAGVEFHLGYSPERIDPGNRMWGLINTPKVVSGINEASRQAVSRFYHSMVERVVPVGSTEVAELSKILENTFRHVNIALVNEMAMFAADLEIDIWEAIEAASTKPFGYMRFTPGPGVGGHCLPVDPSYLSWRVKQALGISFRFIELANDINAHMPEYVVRRLMAGLNRRAKAVNGADILVIGLSYKRNSSDLRESPGLVISRRLTAMGARVRAVDPMLDPELFPPEATPVELTEEEVQISDAVIIVTDHDDLDWDTLREAPYVLDTRRRLPPSKAVEYL